MSETIILDGLEFYVYPIGTTFKAVEGVYAFLRKNPTNWSVIYVGETENLDQRIGSNLSQHHRYDCIITRERATHIAVRAVPGPRQNRLDIETRLRTKYDPPCNKQ